MAFMEKGVLKSHMRVHTGDRPFVCPLEGCRKSYKQRQGLRRHMQSTHAANPEQ